MPAFSTHTTSPPPSTSLTRVGTFFFTIDERTLKHHYHPKAVTLGFKLGVVYYMSLDKCIITCIHHCRIVHFTAVKIPWFCLFIPRYSLTSKKPLIFNCLYSLAFCRHHLVGIIQHIAFSFGSHCLFKFLLFLQPPT